MVLFKIFIFSILCFSLIACDLNTQIYGTLSSTQPPVEDLTPRFNISSLPQQVPENYPYVGYVEIENVQSAATYSFESNTCQNLTIDSASGRLNGILPHLETESCSFVIKATTASDVYFSDSLELVFTEPLSFSFDQINTTIIKGQPKKTVSIIVTPPPPYTSTINYNLISIMGNDILALKDFNSRGSLTIVAGIENQILDLEIPPDSTHTGVDYQILTLQQKPTEALTKLDITLVENLPPPVSLVSAGGYNTCAILVGKLYCWGDNKGLQVGDGGISNIVVSPYRIGVSENWTDVESGIGDNGYSHTCGIDGGKLFCWGLDSLGRLGNGANSDQSSPEQIGVSTTWQKVTTGYYHSCGIDAGTLYCWGSDASAQIGNGANTANIQSPEVIGVLPSLWTDVSAGINHTCGINDGRLYCWGSNTYGQLGLGNLGGGDVDIPTEVVGGVIDWTDVEVGSEHTCGIASGALYCWGRDDYGVLGVGPTSDDIGAPTQVGNSTNWQDLSAGSSKTCGIESGQLFCWGGGTSTTPQQIGSLTSWTSISNKKSHFCGIQNQKLQCWGRDIEGQLGNGHQSSSTLVPIKVGIPETGTVQSVSADARVLIDGKIYGWGSAQGFQWKLINDQEGWSTLPNACGLKGGELYCGSLKKGVLTNWTAASDYYLVYCGIESGKLYCWGNNLFGQVGNGTNVDVAEPTQIGVLENWQKISAGMTHVCGIESGRLYCWGYDGFAQLGDGGTNTNMSSPQLIGANTNWTQVSSGAYHTCGIESGRLFCWGDDSLGAIGNPAFASSSPVPLQIGAENTWEWISAGMHYTCGIKLGELYCWGYNNYGQLGLGSRNLSQETPVRVGTSNMWTRIHLSLFAERGCGINDGDIYCFGKDVNISNRVDVPIDIVEFD